jgi:sec-independent protein translocase protein TatA
MGIFKILLILLIVLLIFGGSRLGAIGRGLGEGIKSFKKALSGGSDKPPKAVAKEPLQLPAKPADSSADTERAASSEPVSPPKAATAQEPVSPPKAATAQEPVSPPKDEQRDA